jgi:parallel beta-helix repeat protein
MEVTKDMNRAVFASLTILCVLSVSSITGLTHLAKADSGSIYIRADGSIDPPTAPIAIVDNITYTFTGDVNESISMLAIVVERDNIVVDGQGYTVQGTGSGTGTGITLSERNNVTIKNMTIKTFGIGIYVCNSSSHNSFSGNNITANSYGIAIVYSSDNSISGNSITANKWDGIDVGNSSSYNNISGNKITANNGDGIFIDFSSNNSMNRNNLTNNGEGIRFYYSCSNNSVNGNNMANNGNGTTFYYSSSDNTIYHNNFLNNTNQVYSSSSTNLWDNGFEGNYWSDYIGTDSNQDGIGDAPYIIDTDNTDHCPLMGLFHSFYTHQSELEVISNSTIGDVALSFVIIPFGPIPWYLHLSGVTGQEGTTGFCRITFPNILMNSSSYPIREGNPPNSSQISGRILMSNGTHTTLYFTYVHPVLDSRIDVLSEFQSFLILPLFFIAILLTVTLFRKRRTKCLRIDKFKHEKT